MWFWLAFFLSLATSGPNSPSLAPYFQPEKFVTVRGVKLHYRLRGKMKKGRETLLFLHGFGGSTISWRHQLRDLSSKYTVYALDLKGFGFSEKPLGTSYSANSQARLVAAFMKAKKVSKAHVIGHSMGGGIALELARIHPQKVSTLTLVAPAARLKSKNSPSRTSTPAPWSQALLKEFYLFIARNPRLGKSLGHWIIGRSLKNSVHRKEVITDEVIRAYARPLLDPRFVQALFSMSKKGGPFLDPTRISTPTLIIWGEKDTVVPLALGRKLHRKLPQSQLVIMSQTGHLPAEEYARVFNLHLKEFLARQKKKQLPNRKKGN